MATSSAVAVTDAAAVPITPPMGYLKEFVIHNNGGDTVYLGASNVGAANGLILSSGEDWIGSLADQETLYARCDAGDSCTLIVFGTGAA